MNRFKERLLARLQGPANRDRGPRKNSDAGRALPGNSVAPIASPMLPVPAPAAALSAIAKPAALDFDREERALRDEKIQFLQLCWAEKQRGSSWQRAASTVAMRDAELMPRLAAREMLTYDNCRLWRGVIGSAVDGRPAFGNRDKLLRKYGKNSDREFERQGDPAFWRGVMACYLNAQHPKIAKIYRKCADKWRREYPDRVIPSLRAVSYYISQKYPRRMLALARGGEVEFNQKFRDYLERDPETIRPNECWVADSRELDFLIKTEGPDGNWIAVRPWVMVILDVKSEHVVSCQLGIESITNAVIRNGLAEGISKYGRPSVFLIDNGKDYCAKGFTSPVVFTPSVDGEEFYPHSIMQELDIEVRKALPYNAQSKVVERFFREMMEDDAFRRGYVGNCPANRPTTAGVWAKPENCGRLMSEWQAGEAIDSFIRAYHAKPNSGKYCKGMTPAQAFAPELRLDRAQMSYEEYFFALLKPLATSRVVDPRGPSVSVGKLRYVAVDRTKLWPHDGKPVMIKFDNVKLDRCFAFTLDGKFLTECRRPEYLPYFARTEEEKKRVSDALHRRESERKELRTLIMSETMGLHRLDPATIFALDAETLEAGIRLKLIDRRTSVKGETHNPSIYALPSEPEPAAPQMLPAPAPRAETPAKPAPRRADPAMVARLNELLKRK